MILHRLHSRAAGVLARRAGVRVFRFFERVDETVPVAAPGIDVRLLSLAEALRLCADPALELKAETVADARRRGDLCIGAFEDGRVAGYCWVAFAALPHLDGVWVDFDPRAAWIYKSLVLPAYRGRGVAPALYHAGHEAALGYGRERSLICVESHNVPSIRAALRGRYASCGVGGYLRLGGALRGWLSPRAAQAGVRFRLPPNVSLSGAGLRRPA